MRRIWMPLVLALACAKVTPPETPAALPEPPPQPAVMPAPTPVTPAPRPRTGLYALDEALEDALSGPWTYVGTGPWTGNARVKACAYRNERVLIVNVYCTIKEVKAFRVDVFSPTRGRVRIYAEARAPVSTLSRRDYFTFTAESEPAVHALPPVRLDMSFANLLSYDGRRYRAFLPSCYGGVELGRRAWGCTRNLAGQAGTFNDTNRAFLREPPPSWYRVVTDLRALAQQHGQDPP